MSVKGLTTKILSQNMRILNLADGLVVTMQKAIIMYNYCVEVQPHMNLSPILITLAIKCYIIVYNSNKLNLLGHY